MVNFILCTVMKTSLNFRSSRTEVFFGKSVLKIWSKFTGEHPCGSVISINLHSKFIGEHPCRSVISINLHSKFIGEHPCRSVISINLLSKFIGEHPCRSVISINLLSKFIEEHPCRSVISINLLSKFIEIKLRHGKFIEIKLRHGCSPVNLLHIFRTPFSKNTSGWLFLKFVFQRLLWVKMSQNEYLEHWWSKKYCLWEWI